MLDWLANPEVWVALGTLTALEIVLGIDHIIFISVLVGRLPEAQRTFARRLGLGLAMMARLGLLFSISWIMGLTQPRFALLGNQISGRDLILIGGGLFLLAKATHEMLVWNALRQLGADPTCITPLADVNGVASVGVMQLLADPRTSIAQSLHAIQWKGMLQWLNPASFPRGGPPSDAPCSPIDTVFVVDSGNL